MKRNNLTNQQDQSQQSGYRTSQDDQQSEQCQDGGSASEKKH